MIALGVLFLAVGALAFDPFYRQALDGRIVGGRDVQIEQFPHQLSLQMYGSHICGASIIGDVWALTASHCVDGSYPSEMSLRAGSSIKGQGGAVYDVSRIIMHPDYGNLDYDFALLKVSRPFSLSSKAKIISLASSEPAPGQKVNVSGWGALSSGGGSPRQLQAVEVIMVSRAECDSDYNGGITQRMICAGASGKDSCQGDSGGPLVQGDLLVGVVSWGRGCATPGYPGVYSNVANKDIRAWIKKETGI